MILNVTNKYTCTYMLSENIVFFSTEYRRKMAPSSKEPRFVKRQTNTTEIVPADKFIARARFQRSQPASNKIIPTYSCSIFEKSMTHRFINQCLERDSDIDERLFLHSWELKLKLFYFWKFCKMSCIVCVVFYLCWGAGAKLSRGKAQQE